MGMIGQLFAMLFGGNRNVVAETAEVFRVNAEAKDARGHALQGKALEQFAAEFLKGRRRPFDRFMDALNRIPRPAMALGTLGLFIAAMVDPVWFAARMTGIALVPEPLWWLLGAIVSFYFGARHQAKGQDFQREVARTIAAVPGVVQQVRDIEALPTGPEADLAVVGPKAAFGPEPDAEPMAVPVSEAAPAPAAGEEDNPALTEWLKRRA